MAMMFYVAFLFAGIIIGFLAGVLWVGLLKWYFKGAISDDKR